jgi:ankyrin repeat protein
LSSHFFYVISLKAVILNDIKKVEQLLKTGKNINEKDEHGRTALHYGEII